MRHALRRVGGEFDATGLSVALDHAIEPWLMNRHVAAVELLDLLRIDIHAHDVVAGIGQAGTRDQTDVARAKDRHTHGRCLLIR